MQGGNASTASVRSWQVRAAGYALSVSLRRCWRRGWNEASGPSRRTVRTETSKAAATGTLRKVLAGSARGRRPNHALQRIAARWRIGINLNSLVWAARAEGGR